jgi:threonine/homoserine/homoserine lactone efflux protein
LSIVRFDLLQDMGVLYRGLLLGVIMAAPVGPVGLLCIRRTLQKGMLAGFATGFGSAFADALFCAVAAFGVAVVMELVQSHNQPIYILGGLFLLFAAWHSWRDNPRQPKPEEAEAKIKKLGLHLSGAAKAMVGSFMITLTNPATLFGALTLVATIGRPHNRAEAAVIVGGIFLGASSWWVLLSGGTSLLRRHFTEKGVIWINRFTAVALVPLAFWALVTGLVGLWGN